MPTPEEFRERLLQQLESALCRPEMCGGDLNGASLIYELRLEDLCFLDGRKGALQAQFEQLRAHRMYNASRIGGALRFRINNLGGRMEWFRLANEAASVYAEIAYRLGYLQVARKLTQEQWRHQMRILKGERRWLTGLPRAKDVEDAFGIPSFVIGSEWDRTLCYVAHDPSQPWVCFDHQIVDELFRDSLDSDVARNFAAWHAHLGVGNPPLRTIRWQTPNYFRMVWATYGRQMLGKARGRRTEAEA